MTGIKRGQIRRAFDLYVDQIHTLNTREDMQVVINRAEARASDMIRADPSKTGFTEKQLKRVYKAVQERQAYLGWEDVGKDIAKEAARTGASAALRRGR